jgi:hypothetical protein
MTHWIIFFVLFAISVGHYRSKQPSNPEPTETAVQPTISLRKPINTGEYRTEHKLIKEYIKSEIFKKIEKISDIPRVYVGPMFYSLSVADKRMVLRTVLNHAVKQDHMIEYVDIYEESTGTQIGKFDGAILKLY